MTITPSSIANVHLERNRLTAGDHEKFAEHRRSVTKIIVESAATNHRSLCLLGTGNGNDVDWEIIAEHFDQICLVDLDGVALRQCVAGLPSSVADKMFLKESIDVSGILSELDSLRSISSAPNREPIEVIPLDELCDVAREAPRRLALGQWDVVVSTCLLSQLVDSAIIGLGSEHSMLSDLILAIRDGHLALLDAMTHEHGIGILITDFVSSDTLPQLSNVGDHELPSLVYQALTDRNFFTGLNPAVLLDRLKRISAGRQAAIKTHDVWRWKMGPRIFAVCAIEFRPS